MILEIFLESYIQKLLIYIFLCYNSVSGKVKTTKLNVEGIPMRSPIAQLVEQVTVNHLAAGSSPARGAIFILGRVFD